MPSDDGGVDEVLAAELDGLALDDALELGGGDERAGGGEGAEHDFKAESAALDGAEVVDVDHEFADADEGRGEGAERVGERGPLGHGGHGDGDGHPRADDGAEGEAGDDPGPGDDVRADERADDGREHAAFGEEHAAAGGVGVRHHFERRG